MLCLQCERKKLGIPLRRDAVGNAGNKHDGQLVGQLIYRSCQDVSDHSVALLALPEQLLGATLTASHNPRTNPSNGYISSVRATRLVDGREL